MQICAILQRVLTILSDIGRFEQYLNVTYPTRPEKINLKNLIWYAFNCPCLIQNGLDTTRNYPNIFRYHPILPNIARYGPILPQYCPIMPKIALYWVISPHIAQNTGPFNVPITVMVRNEKLACHLTITVLSWILSRILS